MAHNGRLHVAVVGLRFGGYFPPIYAAHPDVSQVTLCDADAGTLQTFGEKLPTARRAMRIEDVLSDESVDAVHLLTPIPSHGELTLKVLEAGKHCACTVPMGVTLDELAAIVRLQRRTGLNYMMMETAAYTYHCLAAEEMLQRGEFGRIQFLRGAHYQDMENWPAYWMGLPPMHYATHAVAPVLKLSGRRAKRVHCFGSGIMRAELHGQYGNPFPVETAIFQLDGECLSAEITRSLFHTAREYAEIFSVYAEKASFEWSLENDMPVIYRMGPLQERRGRPITRERALPRSFRDRLPESIRRFDGHEIVPDPKNPHQSVVQGGGHHGSHPHLVHEFVRSIIEARPPAIEAVTAANWTAAGLCAHQSAMNNGAAVEIPVFE